MAKKTDSKDSTQKKRLQKELTDLITGISEEGLVFLINQANTLLHNQRTEQLNREIDEINRKKGADSGRSTESSKQKPGTFVIDINQSESGKNYHFNVNGSKHFFDLEETRKIVALCYRPETKSAALRYLFEFFSAERDDVLMEHGIKSASSPFFEALFKEVRSVFTLEHQD